MGRELEGGPAVVTLSPGALEEAGKIQGQPGPEIGESSARAGEPCTLHALAEAEAAFSLLPAFLPLGVHLSTLPSYPPGPP